ncbi:hypothetical protein PMAYCL1PPCAC_13292, partial [Pristionchus mayeri]
LFEMNIFRKKSANSQSSFTVLDESQDSLKPKSACSIGCDPIFEWKECSDSSVNCDISIPVGSGDFEDVDKENQDRTFWKRAVEARQELIDELNESADEISFRAFDASHKALQNQIKYDRLYLNLERANSEKCERASTEEGEEEEEEEGGGEEKDEEEEQLLEEEESEVEEDDEEEEYEENSYQRLDVSDDQESE